MTPLRPVVLSLMRHAQPLRVLVVDNEASICRALQILFEREGMAVVTSTSGEAALGYLGAERFDLMLVDLRMPDLRGDVLFHLAVGAQPHLAKRTIFMTGDISEQAAHLIEACACPVLLKPFDLRDVTARVRDMVPRSRNESA